MSANPGRAPYRSRLRKEGAQATRSRIILAAHELFRRRGYDLTTIEAVADAAGVASDTVFASVGRKPVLFREVVEAAMSLADKPRPIHERPYMQAFTEARDSAGMIRAFVASVITTYEHLGPLLEILDAVASRQPELSRLRESVARRRDHWISEFLEMLDARDPPILPRAEAAHLLDALTLPATYSSLIGRGWSVERIVGSLAVALTALLYPAQVGPPDAG